MRMPGLQSRTLAIGQVVTRGRTRRRRLLIQVNVFLSLSSCSHPAALRPKMYNGRTSACATLFESVYSTLVLVGYRDQQIKRWVQKELRMKTWLPDPRSAWPRDAHDDWQ